MDQDQLPASDRCPLLLALAAIALELLNGSKVWGNKPVSTDDERARDLYRHTCPMVYFARYRHSPMTEAGPLTRKRLVGKRGSQSSRNLGLKFNAIGSLTIFLQAVVSGGIRSSKWLPVRTAEAFALTTPAYESKGGPDRMNATCTPSFDNTLRTAQFQGDQAIEMENCSDGF